MSHSKTFLAIDHLVKHVQETASHLNSTLPPAGMALMSVASSMHKLNEQMERDRIASILDGTHEALQPIARLLRLKGEKDHFKMLDLFFDGDTKLSESSTEKQLFQRFVGVYYRRMWAHHGIEEQVLARRCYTPNEDTMVTGYWVSQGHMVFDFDDEAGFRHSLTLNKLFGTNPSNTYRVESLWMNETFELAFDSIGLNWLKANLHDQMSAAYEISADEYLPVDPETVMAKVTAIDDVNSLAHFNRMTMQYPGDPVAYLPSGRVDVSYHYFAGSDKHQLTMNFYPDGHRALLGLHDSSHQHITFEYLPTGIQQWISDNISDTILAKLEEIEKERSGDPS